MQRLPPPPKAKTERQDASNRKYCGGEQNVLEIVFRKLHAAKKVSVAKRAKR
jgi:hypothetical protein